MLLAMGMTAHAQPPTDALIERGIELRMQHKDREALEQFRKAYEAQPSPRAMAQIGLAEQALGAWADAEKHITEALSSSSDPWIRKHQALLSESLRVVGTHLGSLEVESSVSGAELWVNGAKTADLPLSAPVRVEIGTAVIEVRKHGFVAVRRPVEIAPGVVARERVVLVPESAQASDSGPPALASVTPPPSSGSRPSEPAPTSRASKPIAGYVIGGVGVLGLAVAGTFGGLALSKKGQLSPDCAKDHLCGAPSDAEANKAAHRYALVADVGAAVGVVGLGVGLWMLLGSPKSQDKPAHAAAWQPLLGPGWMGCRGTF